MNNAPTDRNEQLTHWKKERDRLKTLWVVSVIVFWLSVVFQIGLFLYNGQANILLISIIGGMMVLGVALKVRLQLHLRKKPDI